MLDMELLELGNGIEEALRLNIEGKLLPDHERHYHHSLLVVSYMKQILGKEANEPDDKIVLVPAAYLHDIGYAGKLPPGYDYRQLRDNKAAHMVTGALLASEITCKLGFTPQHIEEISHLVGIHDKIDYLKTPREIMLMEADSLAMIDYGNVANTLPKDQLGEFLSKYEGRRAQKFQTDTGKNLRDKLLPMAWATYDRMAI